MCEKGIAWSAGESRAWKGAIVGEEVVRVSQGCDHASESTQTVSEGERWQKEDGEISHHQSYHANKFARLQRGQEVSGFAPAKGSSGGLSRVNWGARVQ